MKDLIIRKYQPADYSAVLDIWLKTGLGGPQRGDNQKTIEKSIKLGGMLLVAEIKNGHVVATSWMTFDGRRLHLHHFGVLPKYQQQGIGRMLAMESIQVAKRKNIQMKLEVHRSNRHAIELYKKLGFNYLGDYLVYIMRDYSEV